MPSSPSAFWSVTSSPTSTPMRSLIFSVMTTPVWLKATASPLVRSASVTKRVNIASSIGTNR